MFKNRLITFAAPLVVATTLGVFWIATISLAEIVISKEAAKIATAMQAAPDSISKSATILDTDRTVLRSGSNGWQCSPTSGPGSTHPMWKGTPYAHIMVPVGPRQTAK